MKYYIDLGNILNIKNRDTIYKKKIFNWFINNKINIERWVTQYNCIKIIDNTNSQLEQGFTK